MMPRDGEMTGKESENNMAGASSAWSSYRGYIPLEDLVSTLVYHHDLTKDVSGKSDM